MLERTSKGFCGVDLHFVVILYLSMFFIHIFFSTSCLTLPWTIARFLDPFCTFSPAHGKSWKWFQPFCYLSATVFSGHFLPTDVFYLTFLPDIFGTTSFYPGFPVSRQLFLKICRASYWSSKHIPDPSVCLIHGNPQTFIHLKFVFMHVNKPNYSAAMKI